MCLFICLCMFGGLFVLNYYIHLLSLSLKKTLKNQPPLGGINSKYNLTLLVPKKYESIDNTTTTIILCFPFHNELNILHLKLLLLSPHVNLFVIAESAYDDRGHPKPLIFSNAKHEHRFVPFQTQILHIIDNYVPQAMNEELGWEMNKRMKKSIGEKIVSQLQVEYPNSIVIMGDADEVPSPESVRWLARHGCPAGTTYEYASTMPTYYYSFVWLGSMRGYSTLSARSMSDEVAFWNAQTEEDFHQTITPLPFYPSGWHCSYCMSSEACVQKLARTNLADGPPFLGLYNWTTTMFDTMHMCGVAAQGDFFTKNTDLRPFLWAQPFYPYLFFPITVCDNNTREHIRSQLLLSLHTSFVDNKINSN